MDKLCFKLNFRHFGGLAYPLIWPTNTRFISLYVENYIYTVYKNVKKTSTHY